MMDKATRRRFERAERNTLPADPGPEPPEEDANAWMIWALKQIPGGLAGLNGLMEPLPKEVAERAEQEAFVAMTPLAPAAMGEAKATAVAVQSPAPAQPPKLPQPPPAPKAWHEEYVRWRIRDAQDYAEEAEAEAEEARDDDDPFGLYEDDDPFGLYEDE